MITAIEMVTDSMRLANILDMSQVPDAEQTASGIRALNQMMANWEVDGIRLGWLPITSSSMQLALEESDEWGVKYNFAVALCGDYGFEPAAYVAREAEKAFARLSKGSAQEVIADLGDLPCESAIANVAWPMG